ncbi:MAG: hypothetical protein OEW78_08385 [Nitrosopumilus sp.]|uniref:hypothetical protein n=1 Tax=Nitrosopumilus sp. TaxID=2024843 RepID=UPI002471CE74|nr:hypothetical protein [Nitrosopumilus sp.]MDH5431879.1 hypothetical protein [Nitrosopumilus sp.]
MANPISVRLKENDQKELERIVDEEGTTNSAIISKIIHEYLNFRRTKEFRGDITLASDILKTRHDAIKKTEIPKIIKSNANYILEEMEYQADIIDFPELVKRIKEWNKENKLSLVIVEKNDSVIFKQKHVLGPVWSEIQCKMYSEMFRCIGEIIENEQHNNNSFSFRIIRQKI